MRRHQPLVNHRALTVSSVVHGTLEIRAAAEWGEGRNRGRDQPFMIDEVGGAAAHILDEGETDHRA
jgi:hypothetical protein